MRVAVVAEFYPRQSDPVLGVWAHRQALAAQAAGAEVHVLVLHRVVPPRASLHAKTGETRKRRVDRLEGGAGEVGEARAGLGKGARALGGLIREPRHQVRDGLPVAYVPYVSPPRWRSYPSWGAWAAPALGIALRRLRRRTSFDLIHAHNAVPAGDAVRRVGLDVPLVVSVHGGDVLYTAPRSAAGREAVARGLGAAQLVLANSRGIAELAGAGGAREVRVVHLGTDPPSGGLARDAEPALVTVGHLVARKRHADVLRALAVLRDRHPTLRYVIVGDGPERVALEGLAARLGIRERVQFCGQLPPPRRSSARGAARCS